MAANRFAHNKVSVSPSSEGFGGEVRVNSFEDTPANIQSADWWNGTSGGMTAADLSRTDLIKQKSIKDFVEKQGLGTSQANRYVHVRIVGTAGARGSLSLALDAARNFRTVV